MLGGVMLVGVMLVGVMLVGGAARVDDGKLTRTWRRAQAYPSGWIRHVIEKSSETTGKRP